MWLAKNVSPSTLIAGLWSMNGVPVLLGWIRDRRGHYAEVLGVAVGRDEELAVVVVDVVFVTRLRGSDDLQRGRWIAGR